MSRRKAGEVEEVHINLTYATSTGQIYSAKVKLAASEGLEGLKAAIVEQVPGFKTQEFILVHEDGEERNILGHINPSRQLTFGKKESMFVIPRRVRVVIKTADQAINCELDTTKTARECIDDILGDASSAKYELGFPAGPKHDYLHLCCGQVPLVSQGWLFDHLFLIRRIYREDIALTIDPTVRQMLLNNLKLAISWNLCYYPVQVWADLAALQLVYEDKEAVDVQYIRQNYTRYVAGAARNDDSVVDMIFRQLKKYHAMTREQAEMMYIQKASDGCQCAYVDRVKLKQKIGMRKTRYLLISPNELVLLKDFGRLAEEVRPFDEYENVVTVDDDLVVMFKTQARWQFNVEQRSSVVLTLHQMSHKIVDNQVEQDLLESHRPRFDSVLEEEITLEPKGLESAMRAPASVLVGESDDELELVPTRFGNESCLVDGDKGFVPPGITKRVLTLAGERGVPYSVGEDVEDLDVVKKLDPNEDVEVEDARPIDADAFFALSSNEMWYNNRLLVGILVIVSLVFVRKLV